MRLLGCRTEFRRHIDWIMWIYDRCRKEEILGFNKVGIVNRKVLQEELKVSDVRGQNEYHKDKYDLFGKNLSYKHIDSPKYI